MTQQKKQREGTDEGKEESGPGQQAARDDNNDLNVQPDPQGVVPAVWRNCETFRG